MTTGQYNFCFLDPDWSIQISSKEAMHKLKPLSYIHVCTSVWKVSDKNSMIWSFFTKFTDQLNIPFPVSLFFRRSSLSFFLFSSSAASSASLSARRASRSFLRASLLLAASSYKKVLNMNYFWMSLPRKWKVVWGWIGIDSGHMPRENYVTKLHTLHVCPHKLANWVSVRWYNYSNLNHGVYNRHASFTICKVCIKPVTLSWFQ